MNAQQPYYRHAFVYGLGAIAFHAANLVLLPIYTHCLTTAEYGSLQIVYRVAEVFHVCLMVQAVKLGTFNLYGRVKPTGANQHTAASVAAVTGVGILFGGVIAWVLAGVFTRQFPSLGDARLLSAGVTVVLLQALTLMPFAMMQARFESIAFVVSMLVIAMTHVAITSYLLVVADWGVWGVIVSLAVTNGVFGTVLTLRELIRTSFIPHRHQMSEFVRFAAPLIPVGLLALVMHNGDQFFLLSTSGTAAVGVYALAYRLTQALNMFAVEPLNQIWQPWIYKVVDRPNGPARMGSAVSGILSLYAFCGVGLVLLRVELISWVSAGEYRQAADLIPALVAAFFFVTASSLSDASFYVRNRTAMRTPIAVCSAVIMLSLYAILIPRLGARGAAYATLIGFATNALLTLRFAQHVYRIQYPWRRMVAVAGSAIALCAVGSVLGTGLAATVFKVVMWLAWPATLWVTGWIDSSEKQQLMQMVAAIWPKRRAQLDAATK